MTDLKTSLIESIIGTLEPIAEGNWRVKKVIEMLMDTAHTKKDNAGSEAPTKQLRSGIMGEFPAEALSTTLEVLRNAREALEQILDDADWVVDYDENEVPIFTVDSARRNNGGSFCGAAGDQAIEAITAIDKVLKGEG